MCVGGGLLWERKERGFITWEVGEHDVYKLGFPVILYCTYNTWNLNKEISEATIPSSKSPVRNPLFEKHPLYSMSVVYICM